jgi:aminomethyltransferase
VDVFIARTGYTGEDGYEISFNVEFSRKILYKLLESGKPYSISLIGLGARDTLRLEACYSLYGHELSDKITPIEASIGFCVKDKPMAFNGKEILLGQKKNGTAQKIVGVELIDKGIIRDHYKVFNTEGNQEIGYVTSGTYSPTLKKSIGLALIKTPYTPIGTDIFINIKGKKLKARVVETPFYKYKGRGK